MRISWRKSIISVSTQLLILSVLEYIHKIFKYVLECIHNIFKYVLEFEGSRPEWCISSMIYSGDTPFWSETLDIYTRYSSVYLNVEMRYSSMYLNIYTRYCINSMDSTPAYRWCMCRVFFLFSFYTSLSLPHRWCMCRVLFLFLYIIFFTPHMMYV